jgi:peptide/nickel transport system permease protein
MGHLVLPTSILGYPSLAYVARMTRSFMLSQLRQEYVLATLAKGLSPFRVVWVHALGNVWVQFVTVIALTFGSLLRGRGAHRDGVRLARSRPLHENSLFSANLNAVVGGTMLIGVVDIVLNMLSDVIYPLVDPRARSRS